MNILRDNFRFYSILYFEKEYLIIAINVNFNLQTKLFLLLYFVKKLILLIAKHIVRILPKTY